MMEERVHSGRAQWPWVVLFVAATVMLLAGGYWHYRSENERIRDEKYQEIAAIGRLKAGQIEQWRDERIADARRSSKAPFFGQALLEWLRNPDNHSIREKLQDRLLLERKEGGYSDVLILDTEYRIVLSSEPQPHSLSPPARQAADRALATHTSTLSDPYRCPQGFVHLDSVGPVLNSEGQPIAVLVFRSNADAVLYPLIQSWPTPSKTAETLLVRRDGEEILFLNRLRHRPETALSLRQPLTSTDLPAVQAVLGREGMFYGRDYRGADVLADLRPIPRSAWFMVAKVDQSEILAEARYRGLVVAIFAVLFIVLAASVTAYVYRYRQVRLYRDLYRSEREKMTALKEFRTTLYSIGDAVITTDTEGLVKQMNQVAEKLTGWQEHEARGKPVGEVFHIVNEETRSRNEDPVARVLREGNVVGLANHTLLVAKDGSERPIADSGAPISDESGAISGVVLVFRDQTEERKAQRALEESEKRYRSLFENMLEGYVYCKMIFEGGRPSDFTYLDANPAFEALTGLKNVVGKKASEVMPRLGEIDQEILEIHGRVAQTGIAEKFEMYVDSLGAWFSASVYSPERGYFISVFDNISERKRAEEALRESEAQYRVLFESINDALFVHYVNEDGSPGRFIQVNDEACQRLGYTREELLQLTPRDISTQDDYKAIENRRRELIENGRTVFDAVHVAKDGRHISVESSVRLFNYFGRPAALSISRDITERRRVEEAKELLQEQLLHSQKMEAVGTLAGGVAHDFNNILQIVLGYSELILSEDNFPSTYRADLEKILQASRGGADLVQRLLTFSRKTEARPRPLNLNRRIEQLQKMLSRTIPKMIEIELVLADDLAPINADPTQMEQVLMNLAVNARDAMPDGGKLSIRTENVTLDAHYAKTHLGAKPGPFVMLSVSDTGKGMDKEIVQHIFEPFFTTKRPGEGTGLGLAMVYGIVKQHGGHIMCYSELLQGTVFKVYFPAIVRDEKPTESVPRPLPRGGSETILLVDDEELVRDLGVRILTKAGYTVITASDGRKALELYETNRQEISLVILDLIMPHMGGKKCLDELLGLDPAVKVVIASGYSADAPTKEALKSGAKGFVNKPYDIRQVLDVVREVLDQEKDQT